jgi:hypothetical protein
MTEVMPGLGPGIHEGKLATVCEVSSMAGPTPAIALHRQR